jgi:hypothetical protein
MVAGRLRACVAATLIVACGGEAGRAEQQSPTGGAPVAPEPLAEPCQFPQGSPWYAVGAGVTDIDLAEVSPEPVRGDGQGAHHVFGADATGRVRVTTHMHYMRFDQFADGLSFWARSELGTFEITFALTDILPADWSYEGDLAAGRPWPMRRATVTDEWQSFTFMFDELQMEAPGEPRVPNELGSEFQILLPEGAEYDLWVDDDVYVCMNTDCARNCQL